MTIYNLTRRELDFFLKERVQRFRPKKFRQIMRIDSSVPEWAERVEIQKIAMYGDVRPTSHIGSDKLMMPTFDRSQNFLSVVEFEAGYDVRDGDLARAAQVGLTALPAKKAAANQTRAEEILEEIAAVGNANNTDWPTLYGIANNASVTATDSPTDGWADSTATSVILNDLHGLVDNVYTGSKELYPADTVLLPVTSYRFVARKRIGDGTSDTILEAFLRQNPDVKRVIPWYKLETAGSGGTTTKRAVAFHSLSEESPRMIIPRELTDHQPKRELFGYVVGQTMRTAGVLIESTLMVRYLDDI